MFPRSVNIPDNNSFFLFGARGTGKSTLVKQVFGQKSHYIDLLMAKYEERYALDPDSLYRDVKGLDKSITHVIIDEVQKVPKLLDLVHKLIEETSINFIMTGSSARKFRHGGANLLAGRAFERSLHPLTFQELGDSFDLDQALCWGSLPNIFKLSESSDKVDFLQSYANSYLKQEVWAEQLIRKLEPFREFLVVAAQQNSKILNYSNIARDVGVDPKVVKTYFQILEDTLLGFILEPYLRSPRKRIHRSPKFYFFDLGVSRSLAGQITVHPKPSTSYYGDLFEQFIILEFFRLEAYRRRDYRFFYLSAQNNEIDLIIERPNQPVACIEIKSIEKLTPDKLNRLANFYDAFPEAEFFCLSRDPNRQQFGRIHALPWSQGLLEI